MKKISKNTILKQGDNKYRPIEVDGVIYWVDKDLELFSYICAIDGSGTAKVVEYKNGHISIVLTKHGTEGAIAYHQQSDWLRIVAQSKQILNGIPVVNLSYLLAKKEADYAVESADLEAGVHFNNGYKSNPNQYTQKDIEKAIGLSRLIADSTKEVFGVESISGLTEICTYGWYERWDVEEILEQINTISVIEVDEIFNILNYE